MKDDFEASDKVLGVQDLIKGINQRNLKYLKFKDLFFQRFALLNKKI